MTDNHFKKIYVSYLENKPALTVLKMPLFVQFLPNFLGFIL